MTEQLKKSKVPLIMLVTISIALILVTFPSPLKYSKKQIDNAANNSFFVGYDYGYIQATDDFLNYHSETFCEKAKQYSEKAYSTFCINTSFCLYHFRTNDSFYEFRYPAISDYCRQMKNWCTKKNFTYNEMEGLRECIIEV